VSRNTQIGIRIPSDLYTVLDEERSRALERGEKITMTELVLKYLRRGLGKSSEVVKGDIDLVPTLERLTHVLERIETKI
jgi:hypothetical protein